MNSTAVLAELPRLRRYARALVGNAAGADDLVQDTLERGLQRAAQWQPGSDLRAWLFSIMHNLRIDQLRRPGLAMVSAEDDFADAPVRATQTDHLEVRDLDAALARLPEAQREVLLLVALEDMAYDTIALTLGVPVGTVMSRLSRGRERLRLILEGHQGTPNQSTVQTTAPTETAASATLAFATPASTTSTATLRVVR